jgi:hypothetical protein
MNPLKPSERQDETDWQRFSSVFKEHIGRLPNRRHIYVKMLYHYFTAGAHEEYVGRLNPNKP